MAPDISKHLERARRSLEKNKLREAVTEYQAVLEEVPSHQEALQALADIHTRLNEPALAAQYYGAQFDRLLETGDGAKASAIFTRFLRSFPQPPDRLMRYGNLMQKQNHTSEAIDQFAAAAEGPPPRSAPGGGQAVASVGPIDLIRSNTRLRTAGSVMR